MGRLTNARAEIKKLLTKANIPLSSIQAAKIYYGSELCPVSERDWIMLYPDHTDEEFTEWFLKINEINYHKGYGGQELFGTIWLKNGLWMTRDEYDGSEWWDLHKRPPLPRK